MKNAFLVLLLVAASVAAFAQGKVNVINDAASLVLLRTDTSRLYTADIGLAGQPIGNNMPLPSGVVLMAGLWAGTSSTALFLYTPNSPSSALMNNPGSAAGAIGPFQVQLNANAATGAPAIPGIPSGTQIGAATHWFQVRVWDSAYPSYAAAFGHAYTRKLYLFQVNPGPSLSYAFTAPAGPNSSWVDAPILVPEWPEPGVPARLAVGAATLFILRRHR